MCCAVTARYTKMEEPRTIDIIKGMCSGMAGRTHSYGFLLEHREDGLSSYRAYAGRLKALGFACSPYFYLYYYGLLLFGKKGCET